MKATPIWFRTIAMLAFAALAVGCASSAGTPNIIDSGTDSKGTGGGSGGSGSGGASADALPDADAGAVDGHGDATDMGQPPAPVLAVSQNNVPVASGSTVTVGGAVVGASTSTVFTIRNTGNAALTVTGVTVDPAGVLSLSAPPGATVAAGSSTMFTVAFNPTAVGTSTATVTIANSAITGFSFTISATATAAPQPAIAVSGSTGDIASGGAQAFGSVAVGTSKDQTITIRNTGTAVLVLSGNPAVTGTGNTDFTLKTPPGSLSIAAGSMTTFVVTYSPAAKGDETGTITIANNTTDIPTFTVNLTGTGTITATGYAVTGANGATSIGTVGGTLQLTATIVPTGATDPGVTWSSGTPTVATVDGTGLVTAVAAGQTTITATAADASGIKGTLTITVAIPFVYFVTQTPTVGTATTTASLANGTFTVNNVYGTSGNAFKFVSPNYYGTSSNGFIAFPTPMTGDFSISATITITTQQKANNACGIGVGMTTGFLATDLYGYAFMRNANNVVNEAYVSSATNVTIPTTFTPPFTNNTPLQIGLSRIGTNVTFSAGPVGAPTSAVVTTTNFTNGTNNFGAGAVYPAISFNNVAATITNLVVTDGAGATVFDSAAGGILVTYVPASLTVSTSATAITKGASSPVTATAVAVGGTISTVTATPADATIVSATVANGATSSIVTLTGLASGTTNVTVTNTSDPNPATNTKTIQVTVNEFSTADTYGTLTGAYPAPGATNAYTDGELALAFDAATTPALNPGGSIKIYNKTDGTLVDSISFANETQTFVTGTSSATINVGSQLARISGNTLFFTPHLGKLAFGGSYYVVIPTMSISGTLNGMPFVGFSNLNTVATWSFTTRPAPTLDPTNITVDGAQTSAASFRTLQGALGALSSIPATTPPTTSFTINITAGTYNELVHYTGPGLTQTININGPAGNNKGDTCVIQYTNGNAMNPTTQTRASVYFAGTNLVLQNVTLINKAVRATLAQAEALYFASGTVAGVTGTLAVNNSSFVSNQDTIQTAGRSWFYNSHVEGNVDFIWGTGDAALFENCTLRVINDGGANYSIFVARTGTTIGATASGTVGKGYVLLNSTVSLDAGTTVFFGRDAGAGAFYDQVALINVMFSSAGNGTLAAGVLGAGLWNVTTPPTILANPSIIGWKATECTGLLAETMTTAPNTSATVDSQATEYDTRDHILNRVVTVTTGAPSGYQAAPTTAGWNVPALATAFGVPAQP